MAKARPALDAPPDVTATVSAIKAERETRPVRIVAAGFLIKKGLARSQRHHQLKNMVDQHHGDGAEASLPYASTQRLRAASSEA